MYLIILVPESSKVRALDSRCEGLHNPRSTSIIEVYWARDEVKLFLKKLKILRLFSFISQWYFTKNYHQFNCLSVVFRFDNSYSYTLFKSAWRVLPIMMYLYLLVLDICQRCVCVGISPPANAIFLKSSQLLLKQYEENLWIILNC